MGQPVSELVKVNEKVTFEVKIAGEGTPLVFLHGAGGLAWNPFLEELSNHYKVYAPHLPGTGKSTGIENIKDLWELSLCYYDLFDALGLESVNLVGFSMGGMISSELAVIDQSRVKQLVVIAPVGLLREEYPIADIFLLLPSEIVELSVVDVNSQIGNQLGNVPKEPNERAAFLANRRKTLRAAAKFMWPPKKGLKSRLYRIKAPTLILWGKEDGIVSSVYAEDFRKNIKNAQVQVFENASHSVTLEKTEEVISAINHFLKP